QDLAGDHCSRSLFAGYFYVWILFVVLQKDIENRLMFLDKVRFQGERFNFIVGDDQIYIVYSGYQISGSEHHRAIGMKILAHTIAEILSLTDVDDLGFLVPK